MKKPDSLRRWLTAFLPDLATHPDRLQIYIETGEILSRRSRSLSFTYRYTVKALFTDFAADTSPLMVAVLAWIEAEQPDLLTATDDVPFRYEAQILDSETVDLELTIVLSENVLVIPHIDGSGFEITPVPEPAQSVGYDAGWPAPGELPRPSFLQGFGNAELLAKSASVEAGE